jgi:bifunctional NMN adenylyltransferase/nudix hydrolase
MLKQHFPETDILKIEDHPLDKQWSEHLDHMIAGHASAEEILIYGSSDQFVNRYTGRYNVKAIGKSFLPDYERLKQGTGQIKRSEDFRNGIAHALANQYSKVYPTVDIAVFRNNRKEVLLGTKEVDSKWRFPGGFTDPEDNSYEDAVKRELMEECGIDQVAGLVFERSFKVDDWRYRYEEDKIITCLFSADHIAGEAQSSDDIAEVRWFSLQQMKTLLDEDKVALEHRDMFRYLLEKYLR